MLAEYHRRSHGGLEETHMRGVLAGMAAVVVFGLVGVAVAQQPVNVTQWRGGARHAPECPGLRTARPSVRPRSATAARCNEQR